MKFLVQVCPLSVVEHYRLPQLLAVLSAHDPRLAALSGATAAAEPSAKGKPSADGCWGLKAWPFQANSALNGHSSSRAPHGSLRCPVRSTPKLCFSLWPSCFLLLPPTGQAWGPLLPRTLIPATYIACRACQIRFFNLLFCLTTCLKKLSHFFF